MGRIIICTTGISIAQGLERFRDGTCPDEYRTRVRNRMEVLRAAHPNDPQSFLVKASAESNSLVRMNAMDTDEVHLLHSETDDGRVCAEELKKLFEDCFEIDCKAHKIVGLQVLDAPRFRRSGVQNLFAKLNEICKPHLDNPEASVVLNAAGGFKSVTPYLTLFGLLYRIPVTYIFEQSPAMITLPPAPINFDYERLSQALNALNHLQDKAVIPREEFFERIRGIAYHERDWFESLLEEEDNQVTLSAFGSLLYETLAREQSSVFLSPRAKAALDESQGNAKGQFLFMLSRVGDPLWRLGKRHAFAGTDLNVYKPGNTAQRMAGFVRGSQIYICELFVNHDAYERELPGKQIADYPIAHFQPWHYPVDAGEPPRSEEEMLAQLGEKLDLQIQYCKEWEQALSAVSEEHQNIKNHLETAKKELNQYRQRCQSLESDLATLTNQMQTLPNG